MSLPVAILAGGLGKRLGSESTQTPKAIIDIGGQPFAAHQIRLLRAAGYTDLVYLVGHLSDRIEAALGDGRRYGVGIRYVRDGPVPLGTGGAIKAALPLLGKQFFVLYGDSYLECDYAAVERSFKDSGRLALMTVCRNDGQWDVSNIQFDGGRVVAYDKAAPTADMRHIDYGLSAFGDVAFRSFDGRSSFDLADVHKHLLDKGELAAFEVHGRFYEIGSPSGLSETRRYLDPQ